VNPEVNTKLHDLLADIKNRQTSYSNAASQVLASISATREPIQLPQSVLALMGQTGIPDLQPYDQNDLLLIMDALAKTLIAVQSVPDTVSSDDGEYLEYVREYRELYTRLTNEQLLSIFTRDKFDGLKPLRAYALANVLTDLTADRRLPVQTVWQSVIDNYTKQGD